MADELEALPAIFMDEYLEEPSLPHVGFTVRLNCDQLEVKLIGSASSLSLSPFSLSPLPALLWLSVVIPLFSLLSSFFRSLSLSSLPSLLWRSIVSPNSFLLCPLSLSLLCPSCGSASSLLSPHSSVLSLSLLCPLSCGSASSLLTPLLAVSSARVEWPFPVAPH